MNSFFFSNLSFSSYSGIHNLLLRQDFCFYNLLYTSGIFSQYSYGSKYELTFILRCYQYSNHDSLRRISFFFLSLFYHHTSPAVTFYAFFLWISWWKDLYTNFLKSVSWFLLFLMNESRFFFLSGFPSQVLINIHWARFPEQYAVYTPPSFQCFINLHLTTIESYSGHQVINDGRSKGFLPQPKRKAITGYFCC